MKRLDYKIEAKPLQVWKFVDAISREFDKTHRECPFAVELQKDLKIVDAWTRHHFENSREFKASRNILVPDALIEYVISSDALGGIAQLLLRDKGNGLTRIECGIKDEFWQSIILFVVGESEEEKEERKRKEIERRKQCEARAPIFFESFRQSLMQEFPNSDTTTTPIQLAASLPRHGAKTTRGANDDTRSKLKRLVEIRATSKRNGKITIAWTAACQQAGITPSTAKNHLPELNRRWDDVNYSPDANDL
jgi:hypothetical protein